MAFYEKEVAEREPLPGVVTGLAYSGSGNGGILFVESTKMAGKGDLQLTGKINRLTASSIKKLLVNPSLNRIIGRRYQGKCATGIDLGKIACLRFENCTQ
jgi:hypothetical protein